MSCNACPTCQGCRAGHLHCRGCRCQPADLVEVVHEVVVSTDEGYFTVAHTRDRGQADALVEKGNSLLDGGPQPWLRFEVREHRVVEIDASSWSRADFIDAIDHPEPEYWFWKDDDDD